jgi:predicted lipid carrier protein YhbT
MKSKNPHILNLSPPLSLNPKWFKGHVAYTMAKYGMSFCVLGMSEEFKENGIAVNALWPRTAIATDAIDLIAGESMRLHSRTVDIITDAAYIILNKDSRSFTGNFVIDEDFLRKEAGITDFTKYSVVPGNSLIPDFFLDDVEMPEEIKKAQTTQKQSTPAAATAAPESKGQNDVTPAMNALKAALNADLVKQVNGVYKFLISDATPSEWYLDLKTGSGDLKSTDFDGKVNVTMTMNADIFNKMITGSMKPTMAFMSGKLKIKGDMGLAMKLEKLMNNMPKPKL